MKYMKKAVSAVFSAAVLLFGFSGISAHAGEPYEVYNYDSWGEAVPSQAGYIAERAVSGFDLGVGALDSPSDIFYAFNGLFYIADSGNNRIIAVDADFGKVRRVYDRFALSDGTGTGLKNPMGVYVSEESGLMYIADSENARVLISDTEGNVIREITKPESELYDQKRTFLPQRVIADKAGNIYVVLNITTGAAMFSPEGEFIGFYGANRVQPTAEIVGERIRNFFTSDEKRARRARNIPASITSFDIDGDFIFTCTASSTQTTDTVKKLNAAGKNIFTDNKTIFGDYTPMYDSFRNELLSPAITDIDIGEDGSINCLDRTTGRIFRYDEDCNLLFIVGTKASQVGGFDRPAAVESAGNRLYVADAGKNTVTIFRETEFGRLVHEATELYNDGYYEEALEPWQEVLKRDGNYRRANLGVASALLRKGDYKGAMKYARLADSSRIYNKAFEGYRLEFVRENFTVIILIAAALTAGVFIVKLGIVKK